ncbi:MAG: hypothetical protein IPH57_08550 [Saprospiraceae bacterium]|nr:hypothetical protein [Saprospiraceae bacterium]
MKYFSLLTMLFLNSFILMGQVPGLFPAYKEWQQINTDTIRLVFPRGLENKAQRISAMIHHLAKENNASIGNKLNKTDIFLINQTLESNGFVSFAPVHSKFFTTAPQQPFAGTIDWMDLLTIHEYRHVMQVNNGIKKIPGFVKKIFGDRLWANMLVVAVPGWFWEGDAVVQETALTYSGRGRIPDFKVRFNTIRDLETPFSYEKMSCGSYRDVVPDHYSLGYQMVNFGIENYGNDLWKKCFEDAVTYKKVFYPFSQSLKNNTGLSTKNFYNEMISKGKSQPAASILPVREQQTIKVTGKDLEFYSFPKFSDSILYALKYAFDDAPYLVRFINGSEIEEKKILPLSFDFGRYDVSEKYIVWDEINMNTRWEYVNYSNIYKHDLRTGKTSAISDKSRFFSPSVSPDQRRVAVIESDREMQCSIVLLDIENGNIIKKIANPENYFFREVDWIDDENIVTVGDRNNENTLMTININSEIINTLVPPVVTAITNVYAQENRIYFSSYYPDGNQNQEIFSFGLDDNLIRKMISGQKYGVSMPAVSAGGKFAFCSKDFNTTNLNIENDISNLRFEIDSTLFFCYKSNFNPGKIADAENGPVVDKITERTFEVKKYNSNMHLINFHSIIPLPLHPNYALQFISTDYLERLGLILTPFYNANDRSFGMNTSIEYGGLYPVFSVGINNRYNLKSLDDDNNEFRLNRLSINTSVGLPLKSNKHNYYTSFFPQIDLYTYSYYGNSPLLKDKKMRSRLDLAASYSRYKLSSYRSMFPSYGISANIRLYDMTHIGDTYAFAANSTVFLPGVMKNNSFRMRFALLYNTTTSSDFDIYDASADYYYARGYTYRPDNKLVVGAKLNYSLPIVYPDISLGRFVFIKRVSANIYFDIDRIVNSEEDISVKRSAGIELLFDNVYFRQFEIPFGIGFDYTPDVEDEKIHLISD